MVWSLAASFHTNIDGTREGAKWRLAQDVSGMITFFLHLAYQMNIGPLLCEH